MNELSNFETEVEKYKGAVLLDFWATWCGPCKQLTPMLERAENKMTGLMALYKVNIDASNTNQELAVEFGVRSVPTLIVFKDGIEISRQIGGFSTQQELETWLKSHATP